MCVESVFFLLCVLVIWCSCRHTSRHWDWPLRRAGNCEHSSASGSRPSQSTYSHMTRPDGWYPGSSCSVQITKDRKLRCGQHSGLRVCNQLMMEEQAVFRKKKPKTLSLFFLQSASFSDRLCSARKAAVDCSWQQITLYILFIMVWKHYFLMLSDVTSLTEVKTNVDWCCLTQKTTKQNKYIYLQMQFCKHLQTCQIWITWIFFIEFDGYIEINNDSS